MRAATSLALLGLCALATPQATAPVAAEALDPDRISTACELLDLWLIR